ncbi:hypothetical protein LCGC14_2685410 [marine sediment metagenome]|uniref:Uncharacterized protein n=1 Tax=marine sediment metagenome TaxID=412755 RepID=A0A0F8ZK34_9ZZZZ
MALHSCCNAVEIIPDLIEIGIVMYNPVEPTSGADIYEVNKKHGSVGYGAGQGNKNRIKE